MTKTYEELFTPEAVEKLAKDGLYVPSKDEMTCNTCLDNTNCEFAWDLYNTGGDCLAVK